MVENRDGRPYDCLFVISVKSLKLLVLQSSWLIRHALNRGSHATESGTTVNVCTVLRNFVANEALNIYTAHNFDAE